MFRGISQDLVELIRHAKTECNACLMQTQNPTMMYIHHTRHKIHRPYACRLFVLYMYLGLRITLYTVGYRLDEVENEQLTGLRNKETRLSSLHSELDSLIWSVDTLKLS